MELTERQIAEILHADVRRLEELSSNVPNCDRYLDPKSQIIYTRIKDGRMEPGKILRITKGADNEDYYFLLFLCALTGKDGKNTYFFELTNEPLENEEKEERNKFLGLGNGVMKLSCELEYREIPPIQTGRKVVTKRTEDDDVVEHYYYMLDEPLIHKLANAVSFEIAVTDGEELEIEFDIPSIRSNKVCFSENWKKAYNLLESGEQLEKTADDKKEKTENAEEEKTSLLKKLFGFFK